MKCMLSSRSRRGQLSSWPTSKFLRLLVIRSLGRKTWSIKGSILPVLSACMTILLSTRSKRRSSGKSSREMTRPGTWSLTSVTTRTGQPKSWLKRSQVLGLSKSRASFNSFNQKMIKSKSLLRAILSSLRLPIPSKALAAKNLLWKRPLNFQQRITTNRLFRSTTWNWPSKDCYTGQKLWILL